MSRSDADLYALARALGEALLASGATIATAESCTGGWIAKALTDVPGSSGWFGTGFVSYSNSAKSDLLGVPTGTLAEHGAVSEPTVRAMAAGCIARSGAEFAVAVSGVAGPGGGTVDKPVGTVWFAFAAGAAIEAERRQFAGDREAVRRETVAHALDTLIRLVRQAH